MTKKHPRVFGATDTAIDRAEQQLGRRLPQAFREWLLANTVGTSITSTSFRSWTTVILV